MSAPPSTAEAGEEQTSALPSVSPTSPPHEFLQGLLIAEQALQNASASWVTGTLALTFILVSSVYTFELYPLFLLGEATLRPFFELAPLLFTLYLPALTMGTFAEERRSGHLEILASLPLSDRALIGGKFLAGLVILIGLLTLTLPWALLFSAYAPLDWGPVITGYLGLLLLGATYLALGLWVSALTEHPFVTWLSSATLCISLYLAGVGAPLLPQPWGTWLYQLSFESHLRPFARGVIDSRDLIFFLVFIGSSLTCAVTTLHRRRWR